MLLLYRETQQTEKKYRIKLKFLSNFFFQLVNIQNFNHKTKTKKLEQRNFFRQLSFIRYCPVFIELLMKKKHNSFFYSLSSSLEMK